MKSFLTSKTIWFGILQMVFGAVGYFTGWMDARQALTLIVTGGGTIGLRFKTTQPIV